MKLVYLTSKVYPSSMANSIQTFWMAKTFSEILANNFLLILGRGEGAKIWDGIPRVETGYLRSRFRALFYLLWFPLCARKYIEGEKTVIYCRDFYLGAIAIAYKKIFHYKIAFEYHESLGKINDSCIVRGSDFLFFISSNLRDYILSKNRYSDYKKSIVTPDGVDLNMFNILESKEECRKKLGLPLDKKIILYTGHLYGWKGVDVLRKASQSLHDDIFVCIVGGSDEECSLKASESPNINFIPSRPHAEIPYWLKAADILVLPNSAKYKISKYWTSPLKLFEYMASGTPMIVSDLPSIREILNERNAYFTEPDDSRDLAGKIEDVFLSYAKAKSLAEQAYKDVREYTWEKRGRRILEFINKKTAYGQR